MRERGSNMGWYLDNNVTCPKCKKENARQCYRNNMLECLYLICPDCGLCLYAEDRQWVVTSSYIDKSIVGKDPKTMLDDPDILVDESKNEDVIPKGTLI